MEKMNEQCKAIANKNHTHLDFKPWDLVWLYLRKERFPLRTKSKFIAREDGCYKIVQRVRDNAYKIELLGDMNIFATFNDGGHSSLYWGWRWGQWRFEGKFSLRGEVDAKQATQSNPLNHVKTLVRIGQMMTYEHAV